MRPLKSSSPGMPGSFGLLQRPSAMTMKRARRSSPWFVPIRPRTPSADDGDVDVSRNRIPDHGWRMGIGFPEIRELVCGVEKLLRALFAQALVALLSIFLPERGDIDIVGRLRRLALRIQSHARTRVCCVNRHVYCMPSAYHVRNS